MGIVDRGLERGLLTKAVVVVHETRSGSPTGLGSPNARAQADLEARAQIAAYSQQAAAATLQAQAVEQVQNAQHVAAEAVRAQDAQKAATAFDAKGNITGLDTGALIDYESSVARPSGQAVRHGQITRKYDVQFNPSTLSITGYGGGLAQITNFSSADDNGRQGHIDYDKADVHLELSVQLVFDGCNNQTSFMQDMLSSSVLSRAANAGVNAIFDNQEPVQKRVEAFVSVLRNTRTRHVTFTWGKQSYSGIINRVNSNYTMFDMSGQPVRATVDFSMTLVDEKVNADSMGIWEEKYQKAFNDNHSYVGAGQRVGGLVNLPL